MTAERDRLRADHAAWTRWGPYLSERAWGTVREDYSANGDAWGSFPHDHARSRAYRWNEDGLAGISDDKGRVCFALALWNGRDPILKERLFGLTGPEGNHGEDVKEYYHYLDATPTSSYLQMLYRYPQAAFPYERLLAESRARGHDDPEFELLDTGIFDEGRYFDVVVEYAKESPTDIAIRLTVTNRGPDAAPIWLLPTLWYRNTWSWGPGQRRGELTSAAIRQDTGSALPAIEGIHPLLGEQLLLCEGADELLFTENDTDLQRLYGVPNPTPFVKDGFHRYVVDGDVAAVNRVGHGTKAAALYRREIAAGATLSIRLRLMVAPVASVIGDGPPGAGEEDLPPRVPAPTPRDWRESAARLGVTGSAAPFATFAATFAARQREADDFYAALAPGQTADLALVFRQAMAGLLWSKQFYHYVVARWLAGDPGQPPPPLERRLGRNHEWRHLYNERVMSMPDAWEYPWYASWDLAFHCLPLALLDPTFAKSQLDLLLREWYPCSPGRPGASI
jgi:hypothetical protein